MNQVNITGMIAYEPIFREEAGNIPHVIMSLRLRYKTRAGEVRRETYRVSAWHNIALWAHDHITVGQIVTIHGYLTQRKTRNGAVATEICAEEIIPSRQTSFKPRDAADSGNNPQLASQNTVDAPPAGISDNAHTANDALTA